MIKRLDDLRRGYDAMHDVIVIGSGPGGAVAADNLAAAGMDVALVEAGAEVTAEDMRLPAPSFLARHYWEGGLRLVGGSSPNPSMQGRCLGGSSVVNSAIMYALPDWVRAEWAKGDHLHDVFLGEGGAALDRGFARVFARTRTAPTAANALARRNEIVRDALVAAGQGGVPLPRAVDGCRGCGTCITGCANGAKQSVDRSYVRDLGGRGGTVYTHSTVDKLLVDSGRAVGVCGRVIDPAGWREVGRFTLRAPRVVVAAGVAQTPYLLLRSGLTGGGLVGRTLYAHLTGGIVGLMREPVLPWHGATQGWGAFSPDVRGLKYESLWAPPSLIAVHWGGVGRSFLASIDDMRRAAVMALVYKARVSGRVTVGPFGQPRMSLKVPIEECHVVARAIKRAVEGLFGAGAESVGTTVTRFVPERFRRPDEARALLDTRLRPHDFHMTFNHVFGSCRMSADPRRGPVDRDGALRGVAGVWLADASIFPGPSAVNPQATIMALSDRVSRRLGDLPL